MKTLKYASLVSLLLLGIASVASANHSWGGYHWARTSNPFTLKLGNNLGSQWTSILDTTSSDWSASAVLNTTIVAGAASRYKSPQRDCGPTYGRVEVCNRTYGNNGWLGLAQIWASGSHIIQGTTKVNDTYFNTSTYNTTAWKNLVMCQEVGHTLGLAHQDEDFYNTNLGTCMDYASDPTTNQHPNAHDYEQLGTIYSHLDSIDTAGASIPSKGGNKANGIGVNLDDPSEWGKAIGKDGKGRDSVFERDLGNGNKVLTDVFWAE